jgi:type I restriction-modification system DNA methylase subunit
MTAKTEEDLRIGFEKLLEPILKDLGIQSNPKYEKSIYNAGRTDALHGQVVIEYEAPFAFKSDKAVHHAYEQLINYIKGLSQEEKRTLFLFDIKFIGVGFDGNKIFFVQYKGEKSKAKAELDDNDFNLIGPYEFHENSARTLLTHLRALARLPLNAENLAQKFGPKSELAPKAVSAFADALEYWGDQVKIRTFFNEWKRLFGIVYGEKFSGQKEKEAEALSELYKVGKETDFQELLFSVHTYFAFLMKLIAAEILTLKETSFNSSLASEITHLTEEQLKMRLNDIEEGGIYTRRGITNFLEGDFFRWYLYAWSPRLNEAIQDITRSLSEFEPATSIINPTASRDLLKKLYQYLVPQKVRHLLGEYYTPDWLAELLLNEVDYDGNTSKRFLDPACGSGTFLVLAIQRAKEYGRKKKEQPLETAKKIASHIWGFDLNPLAVIASRTNYLFALGDLVNQLNNLEIRVYLADSVLWPEKSGQRKLNFAGGENLKIQTSVKEFHVPYIWIQDYGLHMPKAAELVERMVKDKFDSSDAMEHFQKEGLVFPPHEQIVRNFYQEILELENEGRNGIWARFLKNAFAPMIAGKFDYVVGNPPWIRWGYLSKEYREATNPLWHQYGLFSLKGHAARLGGGEKDFSMLFTYASADYYLKKGARLGFLITQEVFKSKGAGEGFRRFRLGEAGENLKVLKAHDLVSVQPFEGAANKTAAIILQKDPKTSYPVKYTLWNRKKGIGKISTDTTLDKALPLLQKRILAARPIGKPTGSWQTISEKQGDLGAIEGENYYKARRGASTEPYGVFWLNINQVMSDGNLIVSNVFEKGKWEIKQVNEVLESDLIYPAVSGGNIDRWNATPREYVLLVQDPKERKGYSEMIMKNNYPRTYSYLLKFKEVLLSRAAYKKYHADSNNPFYSQYNIADYSFTLYKVVWKRMANDIIATVITQFKTPFGYKIIIPTDTTSLIAIDDENEAHYICSIINSNPVREFIKSYSSAGRGFGAPSVMSHVAIPKFVPQNEIHNKLAMISKNCHKLKAEGREKEIKILEEDNDELVKTLFGIYMCDS